MGDKMEVATMNGKLAAAWKRQLVQYDGPIYCVYADEALTGFAALIDEPKIGKFNDVVCIMISLPLWIMLKTLASETVTPFRIAASGSKAIVVGAWQAITGLKYAVRNTQHGAMVHIPLTEFKAI